MMMTQKQPDVHPNTYQLTQLQIKLAYLEDTVDKLNDVVAKQDRQLQALEDTLRLIYQGLDDTPSVSLFDLLKDKPPHY